MKISEFCAYFDRLYPRERACDWDNDGLLVCPDQEREVTSVVTCLDVTFPVIEKAIEIGAELIISHHPLIFSPVKAINEDTIVGQKILLLLQNGISLLSCHTRFDGAENGLNRELAQLLEIKLNPAAVLNPEEPYVGGLGTLPEKMSPEELARLVAETLDCPVRLYSAGAGIETVGLCSGAGKDLIAPALSMGADAFLTGDVSYHTALDAVEAGMTVIDFGHHASECMAASLFADAVEAAAPQTEVFPFYEALGGEIIR